MVLVVHLLKPVVVALNAIANGLLRLVRVEPKAELSSAYTREEVAQLIEESRGEGLLEDEEYDRLAGALGFAEKSIEVVLLPVEALTTLPRGATVAEVEELCAATGYSRFPVRTASDDLVGYVHVKDVLESDEERRARPVSDKWIRPLATVQPHDVLHDALANLQRRGAHMARVVAADGTLLGIVTLEDVLEELVGEIRDAVHLDES